MKRWVYGITIQLQARLILGPCGPRQSRIAMMPNSPVGITGKITSQHGQEMTSFPPQVGG